MKTLIVILVLFSSSLFAADFNCIVEKKINYEMEYPKEHLEKYKFSLKIHDEDSPYPSLERCSFVASENMVTCDQYPIDKVEIDPHANIKKYYYFEGQFDVQLYSDLWFIENNGRGDFAWGQCEVVK